MQYTQTGTNKYADTIFNYSIIDFLFKSGFRTTGLSHSRNNYTRNNNHLGWRARTYPIVEAKGTGVLFEKSPGAETGRHLHPAPNFGYVLEGVLQVRIEAGQTKQLKAGEALAEAANTYHKGKNIGETPR